MADIGRKTLDGDIKLYLGDCLEVMKTFEPGSVNAVITDPPYGINWRSNWNGGHFEVIENDERVYLDWISMISASYLYCFSTWRVMQKFIDAIHEAKYNVNDVLIWDKKAHGAGNLNQYAPVYEMVIFATNKSNGKKLFFEKRKQNILHFWRVDGGATGISTNNLLCHPAQKPTDLIKSMITDCTSPGDLILDPFMGSGTTGVACVQTGRRFIGIEINPGYFAIAEKRIKQAQLQMRMDI